MFISSKTAEELGREYISCKRPGRGVAGIMEEEKAKYGLLLVFDVADGAGNYPAPSIGMC